MPKNNCRIGIVGGMGPMAGVLLQKLIIENTAAAKDQDHIEVVCFTNPCIPDRTKSLRENGGKKFAEAIAGSIKILEKTEANLILMPCNTAHARFFDIQKKSKIPILNIVEITFKKIREQGVSSVGILTTDGAISSRVFCADKTLKIIVPDGASQRKIANIIYEIKSGKYESKQIALRIDSLAEKLLRRGAEKVVLGCTEISLYTHLLKVKNIVDPLSELAKEAVKIAKVY